MEGLETSFDRIEKAISEIQFIINSHSLLHRRRQTQTVFMTYEEGHRLDRNMDSIKREIASCRKMLGSRQGLENENPLETQEETES